ncbi:hypothetical protein GCM10023160_29260 [Brachybacterium paraconglomeratum]|uniref:lycopene cyclase domain-containing protein n=1 Tax=Brachybacterium paraconglomeratum TaxID=173362 RepID=UPI0031EF375B
MTSSVYLIGLLVPTLCMGLLDRRFGLALWRAPRRTLLVLALGIGYFLLWDLAAIAAGHYGMGQSALMTGIMLAPELPLEELVFITFLCYFTLVMWGLLARLDRRLSHPARRTALSAPPAPQAPSAPTLEEER